MFELPVATAHGDQKPAVILDQFDRVPDLRGVEPALATTR
jgi:hypothetical protein